MDKAQTFGIWGCMILGTILLVTTALEGGFDDPVRFTGGASLLLLGAAFWLFRKNAEAVKKAEDALAKEQADSDAGRGGDADRDGDKS
jgi:hypothetical protein